MLFKYRMCNIVCEMFAHNVEHFDVSYTEMLNPPSARTSNWAAAQAEIHTSTHTLMLWCWCAGSLHSWTWSSKSTAFQSKAPHIHNHTQRAVILKSVRGALPSLDQPQPRLNSDLSHLCVCVSCVRVCLCVYAHACVCFVWLCVCVCFVRVCVLLSSVYKCICLFCVYMRVCVRVCVCVHMCA